MTSKRNPIAYLWRETNDRWYRIQTNVPSIVRKLLRRETAKVVSRAINDYMYVFRIRYRRPVNARLSFRRLTGCQNLKPPENGVFTADFRYILNNKN